MSDMVRNVWFQSPYVVIELGGVTAKSLVCESGGKKPKWHKEIKIKGNGEVSMFKFIVKDSGSMFSDDEIGTGILDLNGE